jgi:hypothetical protein
MTSLATINVRGLSPHKLTLLFQLILSSTQIIAVQETHCDSKKAALYSSLIQKHNFMTIWDLGSSTSAGTALFYQAHIPPPYIIHASDRLTAAIFSLNHISTTVAFVYIRNSPFHATSFLNNWPFLINDSTFIGGDWNLTLSQEETTDTPSPRSLITSFKNFALLNQLTIHQNKLHTYHGSSASSLLDRWLSNSHPFPASVIPFLLSDHDILSLSLPTRFDKSWKLNVSTLNDSDLKIKIQCLIDYHLILSSRLISPVDWWLDLKSHLIGVLKTGSQWITKSRKLLSPDILSSLNNDPSPSNRTKATATIKYKIETAKLLARKEWLLSSDMPSPIVFATLRSHQIKSNISALTTNNGTTSDPHSISNIATQFYHFTLQNHPQPQHSSLHSSPFPQHSSPLSTPH